MRNSPCSCLRPVNFTTKSLLQNIKLRSFTYCKWNPMAVQLKRISTHEECKCEEFCLRTRLGGEICSSDLITDKGQREELLGREWLEPTALAHALIVSPWPSWPSWAWQGVLYGEKLVRLGGWPYNHEMVITKIYDDDDDDDDEIYFEDAFSEMKSVIEFGSNRNKQSLFNSGEYICQYFEKAGLFFFPVLQIGLVRFLRPWAQLFEGRLALTRPWLRFNLGFFFFCSKEFSQIIFSTFFRASIHQIVCKKELICNKWIRLS